MGFYNWCALFYGRLLSQASHTRLVSSNLVKANPGILDRFLRKDVVGHSQGMRILHLPGHFNDNINLYLLPYELKEGRVKWSDVSRDAEKCVQGYNPEDMKTLKKLIRAAAPAAYGEDQLRPGWYVFQATSGTLDFETILAPISPTMGIYNWCALFYGRLLSQASHTRLVSSDLVKANPGILDGFLKKELVDHSQGMRILHLPGHIKRMGYVLEPQEIKEGRVEWSEVSRDAEKWVKEYNPEDMKTLKKLIRAAAPAAYGKDQLRPGWYIFQANWSTLDVENMHEMSAEANIKVEGCPYKCYTED
ncbi:hypothetical protein KFL_000070335 [Klebsormidium nitens]|uniref:Uncharacterized protein n=1 Tax=Klebsormidium nitens TaxID=105231 RepID=A0A1Y1HHX1_KLENI|nr:hypothetical protein KFL_000070335 [Klebsormidium nitens]|eukprot:GAQ78064.1 hypothetical protein KFL_000070335 [Klebsormidium nitens]